MAYVVKSGKNTISKEFKTYLEAQAEALKLLEKNPKGKFDIKEV